MLSSTLRTKDGNSKYNAKKRVPGMWDGVIFKGSLSVCACMCMWHGNEEGQAGQANFVEWRGRKGMARMED